MSTFLRTARQPLIGLLLVALIAGATTAAGRATTMPRQTFRDDQPTNQQKATAAPSKGEALHAYEKLPLSFIPNSGQTDPSVRYYAQGSGYRFSFSRTGALLAFVRGKRGSALGLHFLRASRKVEPQGERRAPGKVNYLIGNDPAAWRTDLPTYQEISYRNLWPGVDLVFRGSEGRLKYELLVRPEARMGSISFAYRGARALSLDPHGNLRIRTPLGVLSDERPVSYQDIDGKRVPVESRYVLAGEGAFGFAIGPHDASRPLVIDPGLVYSTLLGGSSNDQGRGIAVDASGSAVVTGLTMSANFPFTPGEDFTLGDGQDAFVAKLNPAGSGLLFSTYLGGSTNTDAGFAVALDVPGNVFVTGTTASTDFPVLGVIGSSYGGSGDGFVTKFSSTGTLLSSRYLGGGGNDQGFGITVDASGSPIVTGVTASSTFPTAPTPGAYDPSWNGLNDAFVTKLTTTLSTLVYSTYLGGSGSDLGEAVALDVMGKAIVTGVTESSNFPFSPLAYDTSYNGLQDAFVTKFNLTGSATEFSTFLGTTGNDQAYGIAVDSAGSPIVTGYTNSSAFPTPAGYDPSYNGGAFDAFVTKFDPTGATLTFSTFLGGGSTDQAFGIALDASGRPTVTGTTNSAGFPATPGAFDQSYNGAGDVFVTRLTATGSSLVYSTFLGGTGVDNGFAIAVDASTSAYVTGGTFPFGAGPFFPTTPLAFDTTANGALDAFVTKLDLIGAPATLMLRPKTATNQVGNPHTVTATVTDFGGQPVPDVTVRFTVTGVNPTGGSDVTDANGEATFTYTGTVAGPDTITAYADTNSSSTQDPGEPSDTATKVWTPGPPATLTLEPTAPPPNTVGETHCVTATVRDVFGNPVPDVTVRFSVPTALATHATPASGSATTNASGQAQFCFSSSLPGEDLIHAFADTNNNGSQDAGEPFGDATKTWVLPTSTEFCEVKITEGGWIVANNDDRSSFGGNGKVPSGASEVQGQEEYQDHGPADPRNVKSIELTATTCSDDLKNATIFGRATIDGSGDYVFRIDVIDNGEPGTDDSYGIIMSDGYASGQQQLQGGNVKIHKN